MLKNINKPYIYQHSITLIYILIYLTYVLYTNLYTKYYSI